MKVFVRNQKNLKFDVDGNINFNVVALDREFNVTFSRNYDEICADLLPNKVIENPEELTEIDPNLFGGKSYWKFFCNSIESVIKILVTEGRPEIDPCFNYTKYTEEELVKNPRVYLVLEEGYFLNSKGGFDFVPNMDMWY
jgi:hypothetical protein